MMAIYSGFPTTYHFLFDGFWNWLWNVVFSILSCLLVTCFWEDPEISSENQKFPVKKVPFGFQTNPLEYSLVYIVYIIITKSWCFDNKTGQFSESIDTKNSDPFLCEMASSVGRSMAWWMLGWTVDGWRGESYYCSSTEMVKSCHYHREYGVFEGRKFLQRACTLIFGWSRMGVYA